MMIFRSFVTQHAMSMLPQSPPPPPTYLTTTPNPSYRTPGHQLRICADAVGKPLKLIPEIQLGLERLDTGVLA